MSACKRRKVCRSTFESHNGWTHKKLEILATQAPKILCHASTLPRSKQIVTTWSYDS